MGPRVEYPAGRSGCQRIDLTGTLDGMLLKLTAFVGAYRERPRYSPDGDQIVFD